MFGDLEQPKFLHFTSYNLIKVYWCIFAELTQTKSLLLLMKKLLGIIFLSLCTSDKNRHRPLILEISAPFWSLKNIWLINSACEDKNQLVRSLFYFHAFHPNQRINCFKSGYSWLSGQMGLAERKTRLK